jgi:tetratricopeptide (TPR) repeat protein
MKISFGRTVVSAACAILIAGCSLEGSGTGAIVGSAGEGRNNAWEGEFNQGKESLASGYFGLALQQFKTALGMNPQSVRALNAVAVTYDRLGRFDLAELYYDRALAIEPESSTTLNNVGYSMLTQERYDEALIYFERALIQKQAPAEARMIAANRQMALDRLQVARQRNGGRDVASAAPVERIRDDCRSAASPAVGRAGDRVFALVTTRVVSEMSDPPCENAGKLRVAMLHTTPAVAQSPEPALVQRPIVPKSVDNLAAATVTPPIVKSAAPKVEISNGAGRNKLAARMRSYLASKGLPAAYLTNAASFKNRSTAIFYKAGHRPAAERFAKQLPIAVELQEVTEGYADIRIRLGTDILEFDNRILYAAKHGERNV